MRRRTGLLVAMLVISAIIVPFIAFQVQAETDAGPDQTVYVDDTVTFDGNTTGDASSIADVTWDFGDGTPTVNGSDPNLLDTTTHTYNETGEYQVTLSVHFNSELNKTETDTLTVTVVENVPPVADAGPDQTVEQTTPEGAEVTLDGSASIDQYGDPLTYNWTWTGGSALGVSPTIMLPPGTTNITLIVDDGKFNATDTVSITVVDTTPPYVNAGEDMTVEAESPDGAEVMLHGEATDDVDIDLDYVWSEGETVLGTEADLLTTLGLGTHILTLNATDDSGNTGTDTVTIEVVDTTPPEINVSVNPDMMWPPNHKYVDVETVVTIDDAVDPSPTLTLVSVTSNEPDNEKGDGNTINDIEILDNTTFRLRAERSGMDLGRTYTITYRATDASGNSAEASVTITVPHNI